MIYWQGGGDRGRVRELHPPRVHRMLFPSQAEQVAFLRKMVELYRSNELVRNKAHDIVFRWAGCPAKAKLCQAVAIARWAQTHVTYVNEGMETFQTPVRTLTYRRADCDDFTTLICALLESIGIPSRLVALWWCRNGVCQYRHIFPQAVVAQRRGQPPRVLHLDATLSIPVQRLTNPIAIAAARGDNPRILVM